MPDPFPTNMTPEQVVGWLFLVMGVVALLWTGFHAMVGETRVERAWGWPERICEDKEPERFAKTIRVSIVGCIVSLTIAFYLLVLA